MTAIVRPPAPAPSMRGGIDARGQARDDRVPAFTSCSVIARARSSPSAEPCDSRSRPGRRRALRLGRRTAAGGHGPSGGSRGRRSRARGGRRRRAVPRRRGRPPPLQRAPVSGAGSSLRAGSVAFERWRRLCSFGHRSALPGLEVRSEMRRWPAAAPQQRDDRRAYATRASAGGSTGAVAGAGWSDRLGRRGGRGRRLRQRVAIVVGAVRRAAEVRRPRPSERPTSGSRSGPSTRSATTRTNSRCVGWRMSPITPAG